MDLFLKFWEGYASCSLVLMVSLSAQKHTHIHTYTYTHIHTCSHTKWDSYRVGN